MGKQTAPNIDYSGVAQAEGEAARGLTEAQTWANRPNQTNPWGSVNWQNTPVWDPTTNQNINRWTQTQELSPALNQALQYQMGLMSGRSQLGYGMMGNISQDLGQGMNWNQFNQPTMVGQQQRMSMANTPGMWSHLQQDIPAYETTGTLRQLDYSGAPDVMAPQFGLQRAEDAIYNRAASRLDPKQQGERQALEIKLRNQGLSPGDQAWNSAFQNLGMTQNDARQAAINESIMGGGREAERMLGMEQGYRGQYTGELMDLGNFANQASQQEFGQRMMAGQQGFQDTLSAANFQNDARNQAFNERLGMMGYNQNQDFRLADYCNNLRQQMINEEVMRRGQGLNEANALISGQQVGLPQFAGFQGAGVAQTPQMLAAAQLMGQQGAANASASNMGWNNLMSGLGSAAGIAGMFSDRRLKRNIKRLGEINGTPWYSFDYVWGESAIGVMADEAPPEAVFMHPSGYLMVDYSKV